MSEIKEIYLRHWAWDVTAILLVISLIIGTLGVFGVTPHIQPYNIQEVYSNDFSNLTNDSQLYVYNTHNIYVYNKTTGNLELNQSDIPLYAGDDGAGFDNYLILRLKNPAPSKDILILSMNITLSDSQTPPEPFPRDYSETPIENTAFLGVAPRENTVNQIHNDSGLYDMVYMTSSPLFPTISTRVGGMRSFGSSLSGVQNVLEKTYPAEDLWSLPTASDKLNTESFSDRTTTNFNIPLSDYPSMETKMYVNANNQSVASYSLIKNATIYFVLNFKVPSKSIVVFQYTTKDMTRKEIVMPMLLPIFEKGNYINIVLYYHSYVSHAVTPTPVRAVDTKGDGEPIHISPRPIGFRSPNTYPNGVVAIGDLKVYSADEHVNYSSMASALFLVYGLLGVATMIAYGLVNEGRLNSSEILILSIVTMIGMIGVISYIMPEILMNTATLVLTVLTLGFGIVWGAFATGKIEFKGQIDEWLANHGDALTIGLAVLTALQYFFQIFP